MLSNSDEGFGVPRDHMGRPMSQAESYRQLLARAEVRDDLAGAGLAGLARMLTHERLRERQYDLLGPVSVEDADDYIGAGIEACEKYATDEAWKV